MSALSNAVAHVGVVVPVHNGAAHLDECLRSVAAQVGIEVACVVVDDGSTDESADIARSFCSGDQRFVLTSQHNGGAAIARNTGMRLLDPTVDFVTFMDSDDVLRPQALHTLLQATRSGDFVGAHGLGDFIDETGAPIDEGRFAEIGRNRVNAPHSLPRRLTVAAPSTFESVLVGSTIFPPGLVLARRSAYEWIGGFDPRVSYAEDWDAIVSLARLGDLAFVDEVLLYYRRHRTNTSTSSRVPEACRRVRVKQHFHGDNSPAQVRAARRAYRANQLLDLFATARGVATNLRSGHFSAAVGGVVRLPIRLGRWVRGRPPIRRRDRDLLLDPENR